ncbi:transketolase [Desulfosporosinus acididurans]|uniref:Transketolase n=1 Tax=Desulfosporosinus acididurans TaxID=476652 RepID=A0A0J1FP40_9FIRM|nr:transketolase [Desulfosporosinus acididurans]KLU65072.1 transketolase [Desulfosporosinus acididurans]
MFAENKSEVIQKVRNCALNMRKNLLKMGLNAGANGAHIGGSFSSVEILAALYAVIMNVDSHKPLAENRDRFVLSKGHCAMAHYAALYECGFLTENELFSFEENEGLFPAHSVMNLEKGIELSSGSLGLGLSFGIGSALAAKRKGQNHIVYVLLGNGECNEGSVWEAIMAAAHFKLGNLTAIIDANKLQLDGDSSNVMKMANLSAIFKGFGWEVHEIDGNNVEEILDVFSDLEHEEKPNVVIANTTKGKGISFMEGNPSWHHGRLSQEDYEKAIAELEAEGNAI